SCLIYSATAGLRGDLGWSHMLTHTCPHARTHACMYACTHTHTHTHTHTYTHTGMTNQVFIMKANAIQHTIFVIAVVAKLSLKMTFIPCLGQNLVEIKQDT